MLGNNCMLIFIVTLLMTSCSYKSPNSEELVKSNKYDPPVLEVITNASGSVYPKEGDILQMRLFKDGHFEYDDFPDLNPPQSSSFNVIIERKESVLNPEDVKELIDLTQKPDFLTAQEKYISLRPHTDTTWTTIINFNHDGIRKTITAVNFWDTQYYVEDKKNYPNSMIILLEKVEESKAKSIGRVSTQWLHPQNK